MRKDTEVWTVDIANMFKEQFTTDTMKNTSLCSHA